MLAAESCNSDAVMPFGDEVLPFGETAVAVEAAEVLVIRRAAYHSLVLPALARAVSCSNNTHDPHTPYVSVSAIGAADFAWLKSPLSSRVCVGLSRSCATTMLTVTSGSPCATAMNRATVRSMIAC